MGSQEDKPFKMVLMSKLLDSDYLKYQKRI